MPEDRESDELARRLAALERRVAELEAHARPEARSPARTTRPESSPRTERETGSGVRISSNRPAVPPAPRRSRWSGEYWLESGEGWLGRAGVGLVVVGLIFLFRYAVDRGWLTPTLRIGIGLLIGGALLFAGLRYFAERRSFRQILMGGGVVILFITGLAASELYGLVPAAVALAYHALVAAIAFGIARRQRDPVMASIGATGALLPPGFLLEGSVAGTVLWAYLLLMVLWTGLLIATSGWPSFILVSAAAGVLATFHVVPPGSSAQLVARLVLVAAWLCYAALPLARPLLPVRATVAARPLPDLALLGLATAVSLGIAVAAGGWVLGTAHAFETVATLAALGFAALAVPLQAHHTAMPAAVTHPAPPLAQLRLDSFEIAVMAAGVCVGMAAITGFDLPVRVVAVALLATLAIHLAPALRVPLLRWVGHLLFGYIALEFLAGIGRLSARAAFDPFALGLVGALVLAGLAVLRLGESDERAAYLGAIFVVTHVLLATELSDVSGAPWLASAAYALIGSSLVLLGLREQRLLLQRAGMVSLALLILRLFTFDLANAGVGVRILLFLVCGFAFLALSYRFRARREGTSH